MESLRMFWLCLLLSLSPTEADPSTTPLSFSGTHDGGVNSTPTLGSSSVPTYTDSFDIDTNGTRADCLIDTEMGLIALGSAGGLIVCLLVATVVLACQVWHLQRRVNAPRTSRSNLDLVGSAGYWGDDRPEAQGLIGPCDASVMLEEVGADSRTEEDEEYEGQAEARDEGGAGLEDGAMAMAAFNPEDKTPQMQSSSSRDSCLEVPRDLEDMPLVV
ncbi:uncharacterized protein LOC117825866 [Notolabrus celidotus]|uniref:uncharacterized protein LOC117825866 n=1 Tax=Notolabrus celidotus TaxID=1203425 RepID=UPI00148FE14E|nr:uncharacterized protein LOC117825866 [Notolabrus celidotus]